MALDIISMYRLHPEVKYGVFDEIPYGVFISPFYGGDNLHNLTIMTDYDFREQLVNNQRLVNLGRKDIAPVEFSTKEEAEKYANSVAFPGWEE